AGSHTITARYGGDPNFNPSTGTVTQTVTKADSATSVTTSLATSTFGQSVTFTATVSSVAGGPGGSVQFQIDGTNSGTPVPLLNGSAAFPTSTLTAGSHTITARYGGDPNFNPSTGSVAQTVTKADSATSVTTSLATSTFGQSVTFTATVSSVAGVPGGSVQFQIDGANLAPPNSLLNLSPPLTT